MATTSFGQKFYVSAECLDDFLKTMTSPSDDLQKGEDVYHRRRNGFISRLKTVDYVKKYAKSNQKWLILQNETVIDKDSYIQLDNCLCIEYFDDIYLLRGFVWYIW